MAIEYIIIITTTTIVVIIIILRVLMLFVIFHLCGILRDWLTYVVMILF